MATRAEVNTVIDTQNPNNTTALITPLATRTSQKAINDNSFNLTTDNSDNITQGATNLYITPTQSSDITTNNSKISYTDAAAVALNTAKVGITPTQASDITTNTAKISFDSASSTRLANTSGTNTGDQNLTNLVDLTNNQSIGGDKTFTGATVANSLAAFRPVGSEINANIDLININPNTFYVVNALGSAITIDVNDTSNSLFPIGSEFEFSPIDLTNNVTFVALGAQTINSVDGFLKLNKPYSASILKKTAANTWLLIGTLKA